MPMPELQAVLSIDSGAGYDNFINAFSIWFLWLLREGHSMLTWRFFQIKTLYQLRGH